MTGELTSHDQQTKYKKDFEQREVEFSFSVDTDAENIQGHQGRGDDGDVNRWSSVSESRIA